MAQPASIASDAAPVHSTHAASDAVASDSQSEPRITSVRAYRSPTSWLRLLIVLSFGLALDLASKHLAFLHVADRPVLLDRRQMLADLSWSVPFHDSVVALPWGLLDLQLVINRGAVFGIGADQRFFFIAFTIAALLVGLFVFGRLTSNRHRLAHVALGLILAGGIGNLYDRIVFGVVRDFLHMLPDYRLPFGWNWPGGSPEMFPWVFNAADVMLLTGMGLLMLHINLVERKRKQDEEPATSGANASPRAATASSNEPTPRGDSAIS